MLGNLGWQSFQKGITWRGDREWLNGGAPATWRREEWRWPLYVNVRPHAIRRLRGLSASFAVHSRRLKTSIRSVARSFRGVFIFSLNRRDDVCFRRASCTPCLGVTIDAFYLFKYVILKVRIYQYSFLFRRRPRWRRLASKSPQSARSFYADAHVARERI